MKNPPAPTSRFRNLFHSIRFRISLWFVLILAVVLASFSAFVYYRQAQAIYARAESRLSVRLRDLDLLLRRNIFNEDGGPEHLPAISITSNLPLQDNEVIVITDAGDGTATAWGPVNTSATTQLAGLAPRWEAGRVYPVDLETGKDKPERYLFTASPLLYENRILGWITLGQAVDPDGQLRRLLLTLVFTGLGMLAVALLGGFWLADRALKPVQAITQTAREIGSSDLSRRLDLRTHDEIGELAETFNQMLNRLEAAFNRQRQFTADASHELRTPLTIIGLEAGRALASPRSPDEYQQSLQTILSENEFMTRLVGELLTLARMDSGKILMRSEPVDLSGLLLEVAERFSSLAARKGVQLQAGELPEIIIQGDHQYLQQMINNLVENAIKYTPGGPKSLVQVETSAAQLNGRPAARLLVTDTGPGIEPEHLPHVFDRFYRADQARSHNLEEVSTGREENGVGLGLSIVKWVVEMHQGDISISSQPGGGTQVQVILPVTP